MVRSLCIYADITFLKFRFQPQLMWTKPSSPRIQKKNIALTDCAQAGYSITRQSVIAIFFLFLWCARFFSACSPGLVYLGPNSTDKQPWLFRFSHYFYVCVFVLSMVSLSLFQNHMYSASILFSFFFCIGLVTALASHPYLRINST